MPAVTSAVELVLTPEQLKLQVARDCLDGDDYLRAMNLARELMASTDPEVRSGVADIFGWIGRKALPELTVLAADRDEGLATYALHHWEMAVEEISSEAVKAIAVTNAVMQIENPSVIDAMLQHIFSIDLKYSAAALEGLILNARGTPCGVCAREMFEHVAGEPWSSVERTRMLIKGK